MVRSPQELAIRKTSSPLKFSVWKKKYPVWSEFHPPRLWEIAERFPFLFENFRLDVKIGGPCGLARPSFSAGGRAADSQIECDAERRFRHGCEPTGKRIGGVFRRGFRRAHANMVRANRDVPGRLCELLRNVERAAPVEGFDQSIRRAARAGKILASRQTRDFQRWRLAEDFFLRTSRRHTSSCEHNEFPADAVGLFEIMAYEERRSLIRLQRFAELPFERAAQMRVERGKWFIEEQRRRFHG